MTAFTLIDQKAFNQLTKASNLWLMASGLCFAVYFSVLKKIDNDILSVFVGIGFLATTVISMLWIRKRASTSTKGTLSLSDEAIIIQNNIKSLEQIFYLKDIRNITLKHIGHIPGAGSFKDNLGYMLGRLKYPTLSFVDRQGRLHTYNFTFDSYYALQQIQNWQKRYTSSTVVDTVSQSS